ncbi:hypothetical protein [Cohnella sp. GCM10027633]|uniref:hypothetical protein n=1 Tax=unclassified Cohnella TaxID=2636738 RepID=UPI00362BF896
MKLERILRSPLLSAGLFFLLGAAMLMAHYSQTVPEWLLYAMTIGSVGLCAVWVALCVVHNRRHPQRRIRFLTLVPPEFREEDEGQKWMNYRVTRRVYMLYYAAIPLLILLIMLVPDGTAAAIAGLAVLGGIQQLLYGYELRKWDRS